MQTIMVTKSTVSGMDSMDTKHGEHTNSMDTKSKVGMQATAGTMSKVGMQTTVESMSKAGMQTIVNIMCAMPAKNTSSTTDRHATQQHAR